MSRWKTATLGDLLESGIAHLQTGPFGTALKANEYTSEGVPLISVKEIRYGRLEILRNRNRDAASFFAPHKEEMNKS